MAEQLAARAKAVIAIGQTAKAIITAIETYRVGPLPEVIRAETLRDAVKLSRDQAVNGDTILLSPACASYDMFINYEDRGKQFVELVTEISL